MLNERQMQIMQDLENTSTPIVARALASKYNVSLRTIRNDIDEIAYVAKQHGARFIRLPHVGMRIVSDGSMAQAMQENYNSVDFISLNSKRRGIFILFVFLFKKQPITLADLCEFADASRGTIDSEITELNTFWQIII